MFHWIYGMAKSSLFAAAMVFLTIQKLVCQLYVRNVQYARYINCSIKTWHRPNVVVVEMLIFLYRCSALRWETLLCFVTVGIQIMNSRPIDWQSRLLRCSQLKFCSNVVHFSRLVIKSVLADTIQTSHTHPKCYIYAMWNLFIVWCSCITVCVWV